jgi:hypothetical protein
MMPVLMSPFHKCYLRRSPIRPIASWGRWNGVSCCRNSSGNVQLCRPHTGVSVRRCSGWWNVRLDLLE